jgi:hypothetical protein
MKNLSKHHVPKKSDIIPTEKVRELLEFHLDDDIPEELSCKIWTALMCFGLLRNNKSFEIQVEHIEYSKKTGTLNVNCPFETKHRENGFSFFIPDYLHASFLKYYTQLAKKNGRFLKKTNKVNKKRTRNMGLRHPATKFLRMIETKLKLSPYSLTTHFTQRSGATSLADAGISITNLKRAG